MSQEFTTTTIVESTESTVNNTNLESQVTDVTTPNQSTFSLVQSMYSAGAAVGNFVGSLARRVRDTTCNVAGYVKASVIAATPYVVAGGKIAVIAGLIYFAPTVIIACATACWGFTCFALAAGIVVCAPKMVESVKTALDQTALMPQNQVYYC